MTPLPLNQLVPGVRPDPDETLIYWVESDSQPWAEPYRVDLTAYRGHGNCRCMDFCCRKDCKLLRGAEPSTHLECRHIRKARRYLSFQVINAIIEQKQKAANENKQRAKDKASHLAASVPQASATAATSYPEPDPEAMAWD
jgi:hypothetical protein